MIHSTPQIAQPTKRQPAVTESSSVESPSSDIVDLNNGVAAQADAASVSKGTPAIETVVISPVTVSQNKKVPAAKKIKWYGHEADAKQAWLFFEVAGDAGANWSVENRVFFELNDDQLNHVQWKGTGKTETLVCDAKNAKISLAKK